MVVESALEWVAARNVNEIIGKFGGAVQFRNAVNQLQSPLSAA